MDLPTFEALRGNPAALLAAAELAPTDETFLRALTRLQKNFPAELAKAALETVLLRRKAATKFTRADAMFFTREALEQASGEGLARYRAQRFAPFARVADLGCGIGGDAIGLAGVSAVTLVEQDAVRLAMAQANLAVYGGRAEAVCGDALQLLPPAEALWLDPARRSDGRRKFSVRDYAPPLTVVPRLLQHAPALGIKISPGVNLDELAGLECEIEFISYHGDLKECVLWFGVLRSPAPRRATVLPHGATLTAANVEQRLSAPRGFLYEPDPAILRAGLVTTLAAQLDAYQLDADIAYLTADSVRPTPFARAFRIAEAFPFQLKRLRERLRELNVGQVTVKKRGSPLEPEQLIKQLRLKGNEQRIVFLTHVKGAPFVLIGKTEGDADKR